MQVGNFILSQQAPSWEKSNMTETETLRGRALYEALIRIKPDGLTETEWALQAGVNRGFFSNLKTSDGSPRADNLRKLLGVIGASDKDLYEINTASGTTVWQRIKHHSLAGSGGANAVISVPGDGEVVQIQKLDLSLSMGPGTLIDGYVESELVSFDLNFVRQFSRAPTDRLRIVTGVGDSMEPTLFRNDIIVIDTNDRMLTKQDGIYWINLYGAAGIKRLRAIGPKRILVKSDNPIHDDQEVDADDLRIEGRAVWTTRGL